MWQGTRRLFSTPIRPPTGGGGGKKVLAALVIAGITGAYGYFFVQENKQLSQVFRDMPQVRFQEDTKVEEKPKTLKTPEEFALNQVKGVNDRQKFMNFVSENLNGPKATKETTDSKKSLPETISAAKPEPLKKEAPVEKVQEEKVEKKEEKETVKETPKEEPEVIVHIVEFKQEAPQKLPEQAKKEEHHKVEIVDEPKEEQIIKLENPTKEEVQASLATEQPKESHDHAQHQESPKVSPHSEPPKANEHVHESSKETERVHEPEKATEHVHEPAKPTEHVHEPPKTSKSTSTEPEQHLHVEMPSQQEKSLINPEDLQKLNAHNIKDYLHKLKEDLKKEHEEKELRNFDIFFEKIQEIKRSIKAKANETIKKHEDDAKAVIELRDRDWKEILEREIYDAEQHFLAQAKIDETYVEQRTTLNLVERHEQEIHQINEDLKATTEDRIRQLHEILAKINDMEEIQKKYYSSILKLSQIQDLHIHIENLQKTMNCDKGSLTEDLAAIKKLAKDDQTIASALASIDDLYPEMIDNGIPTMSQLHKAFQESANKARKAALMKSKSIWSYVTANIAYYFVPPNVRTIDDNDTFSLLRDAELALERGDLKEFINSLESLKGFPREEVNDILKEVSLRQKLSNLLDVLSLESVSLVKQLVLIKS
ncbi:unnamed protein product [Blepharisma stoltei]|uniref:Mitofilin n=1 Tax=Blepharisma stoltei TaxID=1481888 RepID=A0AAU9JTE0_9CILI|nr:unnamed protein product [Blepharisma stoltei]